MLYYETSANTFTPWIGQALGGIRHPLNIETLWTAQDLAAINLYTAATDEVPAGKRVTSSTIQRIGTTVKVVNTLADETPADFPLSDRQLRLGLIAGGIPLSTITSAIEAIPDAAQKAAAEIWWDRSVVINWDHPMTQSLIALVGLTVEQATALWLAAKDIDNS